MKSLILAGLPFQIFYRNPDYDFYRIRSWEIITLCSINFLRSIASWSCSHRPRFFVVIHIWYETLIEDQRLTDRLVFFLRRLSFTTLPLPCQDIRITLTLMSPEVDQVNCSFAMLSFSVTYCVAFSKSNYTYLV